MPMLQNDGKANANTTYATAGNIECNAEGFVVTVATGIRKGHSFSCNLLQQGWMDIACKVTLKAS